MQLILAEVYFIAEEDSKWDHLFSYDSLRSATKKFDPSMKIGEGGFGQVYKVYIRITILLNIKQIRSPVF